MIPSTGLPLLIIDSADRALGYPLMRTTVGSIIRHISPCQLALIISMLTPDVDKEARAQAARTDGGLGSDRRPSPHQFPSTLINGVQTLNMHATDDASSQFEPPIYLLEASSGLEYSLQRPSPGAHTSPSNVKAAMIDDGGPPLKSGLNSLHEPSARVPPSLGLLIVPAAELAGQLYGLIRHYGQQQKYYRGGPSGRDGFFKVSCFRVSDLLQEKCLSLSVAPSSYKGHRHLSHGNLRKPIPSYIQLPWHTSHCCARG